MPNPKFKGDNFSRTVVLDESTTVEKKCVIFGKKRKNNIENSIFKDVFNKTECSSPFGTSGSDSSLNAKMQQSHCNGSVMKQVYARKMRERKEPIKNRKAKINYSVENLNSTDSSEKFSLFTDTEFPLKEKKRGPLKDLNSKTSRKKAILGKVKVKQEEESKKSTMEDSDTAIPDFDSIANDELIVELASPTVYTSSTPDILTSNKQLNIFNNTTTIHQPKNLNHQIMSEIGEFLCSNDSYSFSRHQPNHPINVTLRKPKKNKGDFTEDFDFSLCSHACDSVIQETSHCVHLDIDSLAQSFHELEVAQCLNSTMKSPVTKLGVLSPIRSGALNLSNISMDLFDDTDGKCSPALEQIKEESNRSCEFSEDENQSSEELQTDEQISDAMDESYIPSRLSYSNVTNASFSQKMTHSLLDASVVTTAEEKVLELCGQTEPISFYSCIPRRIMTKSVKIGEGVYGEVFRATMENQSLALKIIPIEGDIVVNDCPQKKFEEILPEIVIAQELSSLSVNDVNKTNNFCQVRRISCVKGSYPDILLDKWDDFDEKKKSENDRPDNFPEDQLFIIFEFFDGGCAFEKFKFNNYMEIFSTVRQVVFALAVAEESLEFEHRDLHIGNILVKPCKEETVTFRINKSDYIFPTEGVFSTIIDFTISRLKKDGCAVFCDISTDDGLFEGTGDFQFDVYRDMKKENSNNWQKFNPHSNILWIHYLCKKSIMSLKKGKESGKQCRYTKRRLERLIDVVLDYSSCLHLALDEEIWLSA